MNRLFWKLFGICWLAFVAMGLSPALTRHLFDETSPEVANAMPAHSPHALAFYGITLLLALGFSALLHWYLERPLRILRHALGAVSEGRLDTRVHHLLESRRDSLAELGREFDGMAHRLQERIDAQQRLVRDVSHELRSPLTRLQVAIGLAQQDPQKFHATLDRIENESLRLQAMLENMLTLARLEDAEHALPKEETDLLELLAAIAHDSRFEAQARGCDVALAGSGRHPFTAQVETLHRALENVVRNAVKYTHPGTCVEIVLARTASHSRISVADRGPGVDPAMLARIFEPFYRAPQAPGAQGFGIGLAIAQRAIASHGGHIGAENRDGGGLVVTIGLPH